jgi:chromosome segregation ATPase
LLEGLRKIQTQLSIKTEGLIRELAALEEKHRQAEEVSRSERHELEHRNRVAAAENASLRDSLQAAEDRISDQIEQHVKEMGGWESARLAMEQQNRELQEKVARLEEANTRLAFEHRELLVHLEASDRELETSAGELVDELSRIIEKHNNLLGKV